MSENPLHKLAEAHGILPVFRGMDGRTTWTSDDTRRAILRSMGVEAETEHAARAALRDHREATARKIIASEPVLTAGKRASLPVARPCDWGLFAEDGQQIASGAARTRIELPPLNIGVYRLELAAKGLAQGIALPVTPGRAPTLDVRLGRGKAWGVTAALYGLQSERNLGLGDYADLADLAGTVGAAGGGFLGINPIHDWGWGNDAVISPYSPSHRGFLNTLHIAADGIPGLEGNAQARELAQNAAATVDRTSQLIDYGAVRAAKKPLLRALHALFRQSATEAARAQLAAFIRDGGPELQQFATFEALAKQHGADWRFWPDGLRTPAHVPEAAADPVEREFHIWLQWVAAEQLHRASESSHLPLGLYLDLAVGARRDGAEAWMGQAVIAKGVSLGAPPDHLSPEGQNWQLTAYAARRDAQTGYSHFRHVLRQTMRAAGVLRIDHMLGLNRSFWIPDDGTPGAYVAQPFETLLALVEIEAHKAGCIVIGEDLGLVPPGFRETLAAHGLYGYSVLQFEKTEDGSFRDPGDLRPQSLACFATHDTPTLRGFCLGRDIDWWRKLGWIDEDSARKLRVQRRCDVEGLAIDEVNPARSVHRRLAKSPAAMIAVQLDDLLEEEEAQNLPGTIDEHPNWRRKCKVPVTAVETLPALSDLATAMRAAGRVPNCPQGDP